MGGIRVEAETGQSDRARNFCGGRSGGGTAMGGNRLGWNSLSDLLVFGRRVDWRLRHMREKECRGCGAR